MFKRLNNWIQIKWELWVVNKAFDYLFLVAVNCRNEKEHKQIVDTLDILRDYMNKG